MTAIFDWLRANDVILWWLFILSLITFAGTLIALPILIVRIPADYFEPTSRERRASRRGWSPWRILGHVAKNLAGVVLILAGVAMLVLPGQGILTILIGIMLLDFPGKYGLERWIVTRPRVLRTINWIRHKRGHPPLDFDGETIDG